MTPPDSTPPGAQSRSAADVPLPGGDFRMFLTRLGIQGLLSLGLLENPMTGQSQANPEQARMILEDLVMLREKTRGNLDPDEVAALEKVIDDLGSHLEKLMAAAPGGEATDGPAEPNA